MHHCEVMVVVLTPPNAYYTTQKATASFQGDIHRPTEPAILCFYVAVLLYTPHTHFQAHLSPNSTAGEMSQIMRQWEQEEAEVKTEWIFYQ